MSAGPGSIRRCRADERDDILRIVNAAAEAYRGVIPADRWQEPYMPGDELDAEVAAGVAFWGYETGAELLGVMGIQAVDDVDLIRHAYVRPDSARSRPRWSWRARRSLAERWGPGKVEERVEHPHLGDVVDRVAPAGVSDVPSLCVWGREA